MAGYRTRRGRKACLRCSTGHRASREAGAGARVAPYTAPTFVLAARTARSQVRDAYEYMAEIPRAQWSVRGSSALECATPEWVARKVDIIDREDGTHRERVQTRKKVKLSKLSSLQVQIWVMVGSFSFFALVQHTFLFTKSSTQDNLLVFEFGDFFRSKEQLLEASILDLHIPGWVTST